MNSKELKQRPSGAEVAVIKFVYVFRDNFQIVTKTI